MLSHVRPQYSGELIGAGLRLALIGRAGKKEGFLILNRGEVGMRRLLAPDHGASAVEYALLLGLVAMAWSRR